jgi:hypothetical protein
MLRIAGVRCAAIPARVWRLLRAAVLRTTALVLLLLPSYALLAYVVLPASWHLARLPQSEPAITYTAEAIPADPLNVALVGSREQVVESMRAAGWLPADRITFSSGWRDARSVLFNRPYPTAPMSTHYFRGRPQDLAFEQQVGRSPRRRHHVRFWKVEGGKDPLKTIWMGAASYDAKVGVSRFTGEVMHHIDPAVDTERDRLLADLDAAGAAASITRVEGFRRPGSARNGGGDRYFSDGSLGIAVLCP